MTTYWKDANGTKWKVCSCLKSWLPAYQNEMLRVGEIKRGLDVFQTIGGAPDSAGYHLHGGNVDIAQKSTRALRIARNMGGAALPRDSRDGMDPHCHIALKGCTHMRSGPRFQVGDLEAGMNGLSGKRYRKADRGPRDGIKWPLRTYTEGIKWAKAQAKYVRWHGCAFLNVFGDDGGTGTKTFTARLPEMVKDVTEDDDEVIGFCEVRVDQEPAMTKAMKAKGYKRAGYSHRLALYVLPAVEVSVVDFVQYAKQNKGAIEGILRARLKIDGSWVHYGLTHLDYRPGFDAGRVTQMKQGIAAMRAFALRFKLPSWQARTVILGDLNSEAWVIDKALKLNGFKAAAKAVIDFITIGTGRAVLSMSKSATKSDHPIIRAVLGRTPKKK